MIKIDIENISIGQKVNYGFFSNLTFKGFTETEVVLADKNGEERCFFIKLFKKHGTIVD